MPEDPLSANCDSFGKPYRVPDPEKVFSCKACGGRVCATPPEAEDQNPHCHECQTEVSGKESFCTHCGAELAVEQNIDKAKFKRRRSGAEREESRAASRELSNALKFMKILRLWFGLNVIFHGLILAFSPFLFVGPGIIDTQFALLMLAINLATFSLMVIGYFQVNYRPFVWAVVLASIVTLSRGHGVISSEYNTVVTVVSVVWALLFWALVVPTARVRSLIENNPDLTIAKRITGSRSTRGGKVSPQQALKQAEQRAWRKAGMTVAVVSVVVLGSSFAMYKVNKTPPFEDTWAEFQEDWQRGDIESVSQWFSESNRNTQQAELQAARENRQWGRNWPSLSDHEKDVYTSEVTGEPNSAIVEAVVADGTVRYDWGASNGNWHLRSIELPAPEFEPVLIDWKRAWAASDFDRLAGFFVNTEKMKRSLRSIASRRDWEKLPAITDTRVDDAQDGFRSVYFTTELGEVRVDFRLTMDAWAANRIKPPPR